VILPLGTENLMVKYNITQIIGIFKQQIYGYLETLVEAMLYQLVKVVL